MRSEERAGPAALTGRFQIAPVNEDREALRRERGRRKLDGACETDQVEEHEVVAMATEAAPRLPNETKLAPAGEMLLAVVRRRSEIVGTIQKQDAIHACEASGGGFFIESARDAAAHQRDATIDAQPREAQQNGG